LLDRVVAQSSETVCRCVRVLHVIGDAAIATSLEGSLDAPKVWRNAVAEAGAPPVPVAVDDRR
jgi:hypothetical protein